MLQCCHSSHLNLLSVQVDTGCRWQYHKGHVRAYAGTVMSWQDIDLTSLLLPCSMKHEVSWGYSF